MAVAQGIIGYGASVTCDDSGTGAAAGGTIVALADVVQITPPKPSVKEIETTHLLSANRTKTFIPSMVDPDKFEITQRYSSTEFVRMDALRGVMHTWVCIYPDDDPTSGTGVIKQTFDGFVMHTDPEISMDAVIDMKTTIQISKAVVTTNT